MTHSFGDAIAELSRSPARALIVNDAPFAGPLATREQLSHLPYGAPAITCWVPGEDAAAAHLGVVRYLTKPVNRETLLATLCECGSRIRTVLVVDNQPEVLQLFARMLSSAEQGYRVLRAQTGARALTLMRERHPDIVLLDLVMPDMDGHQVLATMRQEPAIADVPVVVVSAADVSGQPLASDTLTVTCGGQLSVRELLSCIWTISGILSPGAPSPDRAPSETPGE